MEQLQAFWQRFLTQAGLPPETTYQQAFHFELTERWANELLALVLRGQKRATASSLYSCQAEGCLPKVGDLNIVTDWAGAPRCVIETTCVTQLPFCEMTFDLCQREGEDDCLESWQRGHRHFFTEEGKALGYAFCEDLPVVFEDFRVIYQEP